MSEFGGGMTLPSREAENLVRLAVEFLICVILTLTLATTWLIEPFIVPSGSMATTLLGSHRQATCPTCGWEFPLGAEFDSPPERVRCPNCQALVGPGHQTPVGWGDRVLVAKNLFRFRRPRRWEVAVFRRPGNASRTYVKRVVGLPGERVSIRHGEVYIDGRLQRKALPTQRALGILLHDNAFLPKNISAWRPESAASAWQGSQSWKFEPTAQQEETLDWLVFRHETRSLYDQIETVEQPPLDVHFYNQLRSGRAVEQLSPVADLRFTCQIQREGSGKLLCKASDGREEFFLRLDFAERSGELFRQGELIQSQTVRPLPNRAKFTLEVSLVDRQFLCAMDGELIFAPWAMQFREPPERVGTRPFALAAEQMRLQLSELKVWRDTYYTQPPELPSAEPEVLWNWETTREYRLGDDEYFVLGDNSAYSEDSRYWPEGPGVPHRLLVGKPILVHLPNGWIQWQERWFQVPAWRRIRYIR